MAPNKSIAGFHPFGLVPVYTPDYERSFQRCFYLSIGKLMIPKERLMENNTFEDNVPSIKLESY
jgi:hypothetical protein